MTDKEKLEAIIAELRRLKKVRGVYKDIYKDIFAFYNSLPSVPASEDLEAAIDTYLATYFDSEREKQDWPFLKKMAIHFANWQKKKDDYAIEIAHMAGEEEGKNIMKQQLMAKAVDGVVHRFNGCGVVSVHYNDPNGIPMAYFIPSEGLSAGDKVKIITIKED